MAVAGQLVSFEKDYIPNPNKSIMQSIFQQYERVLVESLITSFGLDFIIKDQHGGDVDTIHSVREVGKDPQMAYKSSKNRLAYESIEKYDNVAYHRDSRYTTIVNAAKDDFNKNGTWIEDTYVVGNKLAPKRNNTIPRNQQGQLDHVVPAEIIHNDPGRVLAGMSGLELANCPENLRYTNAALNRNMWNMSVEEYISWCEKNPDKVDWNGKKGDPLPENVKARLRDEYARAKKDYEAKLARTYYTSREFRNDMLIAAGNVGMRMGIRQALGFVFAEMWFSVKEEFQKLDNQEVELKEYLEAVAHGIQNGYETAKEKYPELFSRFINGAVAGVLSSFTTTLCNIFFTTAKNTVKIIRQSYASMVEAMKILFINPDDYEFGDRMRAVVKVLFVGASVAVGVLVSDAVAHTPIGALGEVGEIVQSFCGVFVTGIMSCTLLMFLDRSELMNKLVQSLNNIHTLETELNYYREWAKYFEQYAAQLMQLDLEKFKKETEAFRTVADKLKSIETEEELNAALKEAFSSRGLLLPWQGDFDSFMADKSNQLVFE